MKYGIEFDFFHRTVWSEPLHGLRTEFEGQTVTETMIKTPMNTGGQTQKKNVLKFCLFSIIYIYILGIESLKKLSEKLQG
jgi:hypothetical protein